MRTSTQNLRNAVAMVFLATTVCVSSSCSDETQPPSTAKCIGQVRLVGVTYDSVEAVGKSLAQEASGMAEVARCGDMGESPVGPYYPDDAELVQAWSVPEYPATMVIGIRDGALLQVFVAETLSIEERDRIVSDLKRLEAEAG